MILAPHTPKGVISCNLAKGLYYRYKKWNRSCHGMTLQFTILKIVEPRHGVAHDMFIMLLNKLLRNKFQNPIYKPPIREVGGQIFEEV